MRVQVLRGAAASALALVGLIGVGLAQENRFCDAAKPCTQAGSMTCAGYSSGNCVQCFGEGTWRECVPEGIGCVQTTLPGGCGERQTATCKDIGWILPHWVCSGWHVDGLCDATTCQ